MMAVINNNITRRGFFPFYVLPSPGDNASLAIAGSQKVCFVTAENYAC